MVQMTLLYQHFFCESSNLGAFCTLEPKPIPQVWGACPILSNQPAAPKRVQAECPKNSLVHTPKWPNPSVASRGAQLVPVLCSMMVVSTNPKGHVIQSGNHVLLRQIENHQQIPWKRIPKRCLTSWLERVPTTSWWFTVVAHHFLSRNNHFCYVHRSMA